ncbi:MAG: hypothetical protein ACO3L6_03325 [Dehalococcoidia bacterium]
MATKTNQERSHEIPPKASVRRSNAQDEEFFGEAFNGQVISRFMK